MPISQGNTPALHIKYVDDADYEDLRQNGVGEIERWLTRPTNDLTVTVSFRYMLQIFERVEGRTDLTVAASPFKSQIPA